MTPLTNFEYSFKHLLTSEGGFSDHPLDAGGPTNFGITQKTLAQYRKMPVSKSDVKKINMFEAQAVYLMMYWRPMNLDLIKSKQICCLLFDQGVNRGPARAIRMLQKVLAEDFGRAIAIDGVLGPKTAHEVNFLPDLYLGLALTESAQKAYLDICRAKPSQSIFLYGWIARTWRFFNLF